MSRRIFAFISTLTLIVSIAAPAYASSSVQQATTDATAARLDPKAQIEEASFEVVAEDPFKDASEGIFLIRLDDAPLATYRGGVSGLQATSPVATGDQQLDVSSPASVAYVEYLETSQATAVSRIENAIGHTADVRFTYTNSNNGLAVWLTPDEAEQVLRLPGVSFVQPDFERELQTDTGPTWIGAPEIWGEAAACAEGGSCGEGIIVGIIDTGINPINPSFADVGGDGYDHTNPNGSGSYFGVCDIANDGLDDPEIKPYDAGFVCNDKLIGAWGYKSVDAANGVTDGPRDYQGHGSHTAATAAGNFTEATISGGARAPETIDISGVAPHANIIAYAGCCTGSALAASIDQAIADGVDVINYSIGSPSASDVWNDFDTVGFLNAREAGIFVATSAGNEGPGAATIGSPADAPWLTAVGASTHSRTWTNDVTFSGGAGALATIDGNGFTTGYGPAPIVYAGDFGDAGCLAPFAADTWTNGEIVICDRGDIARTDKGVNAAAGGAAGLILANTAEDGLSINADAHAIPASHITFPDGVALRAWLDTGTGHMATISAGVYVQDPARGDIVGGFSSRGENRAIDIVSPSVSAPGVDIIAAHGAQNVTPVWDFLSGTSMASPHVAGAGALLMQENPTWTPAEIQSALMLTANTTVLDSDETTPAGAFDMGNGVVVLGDANSAGLIMSVENADYAAADPALGGDPSSLNLASMANSQCVLECSWERTVTATTAGTWTAAATMGGGAGLTVSPTNFTLGVGESQVLTITADVTGAPRDVWAFGDVSLTATGAPDSHLPVAVAPSTGSLPPTVEIDARRDAGSVAVTDLTAIEITELTVATFGLAAGHIDDIMLDEDPTNGDPFDNVNDGTVWFTTVDVPADAQRFVAETFDTTSPDLDLFVGTGDTPGDATLECVSASGTALEYCNIDDPAPGTYWVLVQNWAGSGVTDAVKVSTGVVSGDEGNLLIEGPAQHPQLDPFDIRVIWNDDAMEPGDKFYGAFSIGTDAAHPGNVGTVPVDVDRVANDVTKTVDSAVAEPGDTLTFTINVDPNPTPTTLTYEIEDLIPDGFTYVPGSATGGLSLRSDGALTWSGSMLPPAAPVWTMTTSTTDAFCAANSYFDLEGLSILANPGIDGNNLAFTTFPDIPFTHFGNDYTGVGFTDDGFAYFGDGLGTGDPFTPQTLPDATSPNNLAAALWHDLEVVYDGPSNAGVTLASDGASFGVIEYDDLQLVGGSASVGDFQVQVASVDDTPGFFEVVFAYDSLDVALLAGAGSATIGIENAAGDEALTFLNNGDPTGLIPESLSVCYDWSSPPRPARVLTYQVTVDAGTEGTVITNEVSHKVNEPGAREETSSVDVAIGDVTPPTDGDNLWVTDVLSSSLTLNWDAATDDRAVTGYGVYQDGAHLADVSAGATTYNVTGLTPDTVYEFSVKAMDAHGNESTGLTLEVTTSRDFTDDDFSIFEEDIEWLFSAGITRGCNPPVNDQFCPDDSLTRGQMAAMLNRGLDLPGATDDHFTDDNDSVFEDDINAVATAGITLGCNPPANDNFCPDDLVTRGEMAAFFDRGLKLPATTTDFFTDDDSSIFEASINRLAEAGITRGCNPPDNDQYCPDDNLTRGQTAAFFRRALG